LTFIVLVVKEIFDVGFSKRMIMINFLLLKKGGAGCHLFEQEGYIVDYYMVSSVSRQDESNPEL